MARVTLFGALRAFTGGAAEVEVEAANIRQLLAALARRYPEMKPHLDQGIAVAIDGQIYQDALLHPIAADADVHLLPQIAGG